MSDEETKSPPEGDEQDAGAEAPETEQPEESAQEEVASASAEAPSPEKAAPEATEEKEPTAAEASGEQAGQEAAPPKDEPAPAADEGEPAQAEDEEAAAKAKAAAAAKAKAAALAAAKAKREAEEALKEVWERDPETPEWQEADDDELVDALRQAAPGAIESARTFAGDLTLGVTREAIRAVATALKEDHGFTLMVDVCGVDYGEREEGRFGVVYHVYSPEKNRRVRLKIATGEDGEVPSVAPVWRGANWPEREVWDMYGIRFADHPDLTRILLWEGFNGYPLRKDFPVEGIDTGSAIYPEYYESGTGPVTKAGTGWLVPEPPAPPEPEQPEAVEDAGEPAADG